jgi:hypothetical protein
VENGFTIFELCHRFVIVFGKFAHTITETRVEDNSFHDCTPFKNFLSINRYLQQEVLYLISRLKSIVLQKILRLPLKITLC